jgi:hypothetical protein
MSECLYGGEFYLDINIIGVLEMSSTKNGNDC